MGSLEKVDLLPHEQAAQTQILHPEDIDFIDVDPDFSHTLQTLMTPHEVIRQREFPQPTPITLDIFPTFESLLTAHEDVRNLKLLPLKSDKEYKRYHNESPVSLRIGVTSYFGESNLAFAKNAFPYELPEDVLQGIAWIKKDSTPDGEVINFMARVLTYLKKRENDVILFERPLMTSARLVRGTMPAFRHIHMWIKK